MSDRAKHMIGVILTMLSSGDKRISELTLRMRNDTDEVKRCVAGELSGRGYIEFYNGKREGGAKKGRIPVFARITDKGRSYMDSSKAAHSSSIWRV